MRHKRIAIVYYSVLLGNTKKLAHKIQNIIIEDFGVIPEVFSINDNPNLNEYDICFIGSPTINLGNMPKPMKNYLTKILKEEPIKTKLFSIYGTGETQWGMQYYCRCVDEMEYHLSKFNKIVLGKLKIEQNPIGKDKKIQKYIHEVLKEVNKNEITKNETI